MTPWRQSQRSCNCFCVGLGSSPHTVLKLLTSHDGTDDIRCNDVARMTFEARAGKQTWRTGRMHPVNPCHVFGHRICFIIGIISNYLSFVHQFWIKHFLTSKGPPSTAPTHWPSPQTGDGASTIRTKFGVWRKTWQVCESVGHLLALCRWRWTIENM